MENKLIKGGFKRFPVYREDVDFSISVCAALFRICLQVVAEKVYILPELAYAD